MFRRAEKDRRMFSGTVSEPNFIPTEHSAPSPWITYVCAVSFPQ